MNKVSTHQPEFFAIPGRIAQGTGVCEKCDRKGVFVLSRLNEQMVCSECVRKFTLDHALVAPVSASQDDDPSRS
jgi:hypothetical protein